MARGNSAARSQLKQEQKVKARSKSLKALGYKLDKNNNVVVDPWLTAHNNECDCDTCILPNLLRWQKDATLEIISKKTKGRVHRKGATVHHVDKNGVKVPMNSKEHHHDTCRSSKDYFCGLRILLNDAMKDRLSVESPEGYARWQVYRNSKVITYQMSDKLSTKEAQKYMNQLYTKFLHEALNHKRAILKRRAERDINFSKFNIDLKAPADWQVQLQEAYKQLAS